MDHVDTNWCSYQVLLYGYLSMLAIVYLLNGVYNFAFMVVMLPNPKHLFVKPNYTWLIL